jgi:hypothetical protein
MITSRRLKEKIEEGSGDGSENISEDRREEWRDSPKKGTQGGLIVLSISL